MEAGDPDAALQKRPRLGSLTPHHHGGPLYHSAGLPPPHHPQRPHPLSQAPSPPNHYPPHSLPPPTPSYPPPHPAASFDASRALPTPSPLTQRPNHGPPVSLPPRSYSQDSAYQSRPPGTPTQLAPADPHRRSIASSEGHHPPHPMDHGPQPHQPMWQPMPYGHHPNGLPPAGVPHNAMPTGLPNGNTIASPQEQYAPQPISSDQIYPPSGVGQYNQSASYGPAGSQYGAMKRKQVRATQACNNCRTRKQKCDENRPCSFCKDNSYECAYKDVPVPKQDRTMREVLDVMTRLADKVDNLDREMKRRLPKQEPSSSAVSPEYNSPTAPLDPANTYGRTIATRAPSEMTSPDSMPAMHGPAHDPMRHNSNLGAPIKMESAVERTPQVVAFREDPSPTTIEESVPGMEDALPADHTTPAHKLLDVWPSMQPFYEHTGVEKSNTNYPLELEERRGLLRIYGKGQGTDLNDGAQAPSSPANSSNGEGQDSSPSPREGLWGTGFTTGSPPDYRQSVGPSTPGGGVTSDWSSKSNIGGQNPDGLLKLDVETVRSLHRSYLQNMDILHPFLDKRRLAKMVENFMLWYSPDVKTSYSPVYGGVPSHVAPNERFAGQKRKRSSNHGDPETGGYPSTRRPPPERSIGNAIVLLVLALGKVCEHKKVLPGPTGEIPSPVDTMRSPGGMNATMGGSPHSDRFHYAQRAHPSQDSNASNIDILPGLAYYAYATDILGNLHGGNEVSHAQAFLLAGLYMGQYVRVLESWSWINTACRVCLILVKKDEKNLGLHPQNKLNSIDAYKLNLLKCVYWTCLQLESDILAELSTLPPSGVSRYQSVVGHPTGVYEEMPMEIGEDENLTWYYYSAQIHLRKILNDAHKQLYTVHKPAEEAKRDVRWAGHVPNTLEKQLQQWRELLPPQLQWNDNDPPSTDINTARMRAKYYGARYIIARPFLYIGVHKMDLPPLACDSSQLGSPSTPSTPDQVQARGNMLVEFNAEQLRLIEVSKRCVDAAIQSTVAFDRVGVDPSLPWKLGDSDHIPERFIVTNIFGTAHAQFGNVLVLAAVYKSRLRTAVGLSKSTVDALLLRTIKVLRRLAPNSPPLKIDAQILENTHKFVNGEKRDDSMSSVSFTGSVNT
ncbi:uncharacterized protein BDZ99DRAFT_527970 [Mytilinidion resinicola]|uniref:Zn(2)-C6 fungal-type domain-containing protein n=1 Tax=Mytilinidion resinicola TaxID=574789 RepID=A0A6A6Y1Z4_9PEZI|nr:uncharacterized protein BDZ99DRAFT_527970 [Mytilinidion resinicola]KAF2802024.1 hypothetical protein BDZ99DRAFT_527970 [Mytilinidion resinicola]